MSAARFDQAAITLRERVACHQPTLDNKMRCNEALLPSLFRWLVHKRLATQDLLQKRRETFLRIVINHSCRQALRLWVSQATRS